GKILVSLTTSPSGDILPPVFTTCEYGIYSLMAGDTFKILKLCLLGEGLCPILTEIHQSAG
ncbi:MAG: hypothetical protein LBP91_01450, partial [Coriobacteriales bacterium]|nr:hypothetical protein [Coriobacteriales bacterium]